MGEENKMMGFCFCLLLVKLLICLVVLLILVFGFVLILGFRGFNFIFFLIENFVNFK